MSENPPFGFTPEDPDDDEQGALEGGSPPGGGFGFGGLPGVPGQGGAGGFDPAQLGAMFSQLGAMLQGSGGEGPVGPVDWPAALRVAREQVVSEGDPSVGAREATEVADTVRLADHWLDGVTAFPATAAEAVAWSRSEWLEATLPSWQRIIEPVAASMQSAMDSMSGGLGDLGDLSALTSEGGPLAGLGLPEGALPPELTSMLGPLMGMAKRMGSMMFGMQVGQALASLSGEVLGAGDVGVPLTGDGRAALLPRNVAAFGEGLGIDLADVRLYLALREAAHQRLFTHVAWLRPRLEDAVREYARGVHVDPARIQDAMRDVDPNNPAGLQEVLSSGVFEPEDTPAQQAALARLETLLALVEGWVDDVVQQAAGDRMPAADALREAVRRRRATGGPAEKTFATLVGLELRPRRLREAAALWAAVRAEQGAEGRDSMWGHPDLLPAPDDLDDPSSFVRRSAPLDIGAIETELGEDIDGDGTVGPVDAD